MIVRVDGRLAMPPFGNLYDMPVYADRNLTGDQEIDFEAGSHVELVQMSYQDYQKLVYSLRRRLWAGWRSFFSALPSICRMRTFR